MYWVRASQSYGVLLLGILFLLLAGSGWVMATHAFRLRSRERIPVGISLGLILFIFFSNLFGRWIPPEWSFWTAGLVVLLIAGLAWFINRGKILDLRDGQVWPQLIVLGLAIVVFTLMGRGLGIFDDRKNLSLISLLAAGDIPPHFYMNSDFLFSYHYGFQLLGAFLMRIGGMYPWSAFDLSKGIAAGLAILLSFIWGRRVSRRFTGGLFFALLLLFASGTRWMLLFLPPSIVGSLSREITLWGSGAQTAQSLLQGLSSSWIIEGGPPIPIPFAFTNGILQPFILYLQTGPRSFALIIFFTLLLIARRRKNLLSQVIVTLLLATWALAAEAEFVLFVLGIGCLTLQVLRSRERIRRSEFRELFVMTFVAGVVSLFQGGTITQILKELFFQAPGAVELSSLGPDMGFGLRIPPAIVSSHLGELNILDPGQLLIALFEIGPLLMLAPLAIWATRKRINRGDYPLGAIGISTIIGFILPIFFSYSVDRDVSRMTQYALVGWIVLSWPSIVALWRGRQASGRLVLAGLGFISVFAGVVITGPLLSAMHTVVFADEIAPVDAVMLRSNWDSLEPGCEILDSDPWRAVVITGRLTRSSASSYETLPSWEDLRTEPFAERVVSAGFDYIYIDTYWWDSMTEPVRSSYGSPCVKLVDEAHDNADNGSRWLFDLRACKSSFD